MNERVFVALGSNLGDRQAALDEALVRLAQLEGTWVIAVAPVLENDALLPPDDPTPQPAYLNTVAELATALEPLPLLTALKNIERDMGRVVSRRWAPRRIDLDLVLYGERVIDEPTLTVPHPGLATRRFVREPLFRLFPTVSDPRTGLPVFQEHAAAPR